MKTELTQKEIAAIIAIANMGCETICSDSFNDLFESNQSFFNRRFLSEKAGFNQHVASGLMSSLEEKGLVINSDPDQFCPWVLTDDGIQAAIDNV